MSKNYCKTEDAPANATGSSVSGTGDDVTGIGKKKKKKKNPWDKYSPDSLGKQFGGQATRKFYMEMKEGKLLDRLAKLAKTGAEAEDIILTLKLDKKFKTGTNGLAWHNLVDTVEKLMKEDRNYRKEYDNYHAKPDQRERNAGRLRARRLMAKLGKVSKGDKMDVHHKDNDPMNNEKGNLSVTTQKYNRTEPRLREDDAVATQPNITPDDTFAGVDVFNVNDDDYNNCKYGKKKHERWSNYVDMDSESGKRIYGYAKKNPKKSIIVQHDKTGHMLYLKKFEKGEE